MRTVGGLVSIGSWCVIVGTIYFIISKNLSGLGHGHMSCVFCC